MNFLSVKQQPEIFKEVTSLPVTSFDYLLKGFKEKYTADNQYVNSSLENQLFTLLFYHYNQLSIAALSVILATTLQETKQWLVSFEQKVQTILEHEKMLDETVKMEVQEIFANQTFFKKSFLPPNFDDSIL